MNFSKEKEKAALVSIGSNTVLILLKLAVGLFANSLSIISEAIHSFTDLMASSIAFFAVKKASYPPDKEHQFGHGKYEDFSGFIEGALIILASGYIIFESIEKIISGKYSHIDTKMGILVMLISVIANIFVSRYLFKVAKKTDSMALLADAEHLKTDIVTSAGVLLGLILISTTHIEILDSIAAIFVALIIFKTGISLCYASGANLLDTSLPKEEQQLIIDTLNSYVPNEVIEVNEIKSRKSGSSKQLEIIIKIPKTLTIEAGHKLCDKIEDDLKNNISNLSVIIHIEPCSNSCDKCIIKKSCK